MRVLNVPLVLVKQQLVQRAVATAVFEQLKSWAQHFRAAQAVQIAQQHWLHAPICFKTLPEGWNLVSLPPPGGFILEFWNLTSCSIAKFKSIASDWRPNHMSVKHWGTAVLCVFIIYCCIGVCCRNRSQKRNQHRFLRGVVWDVHLGCQHAALLRGMQLAPSVRGEWALGVVERWLVSNPKVTWGNPKAPCCSVEVPWSCFWKQSRSEALLCEGSHLNRKLTTPAEPSWDCRPVASSLVTLGKGGR